MASKFAKYKPNGVWGAMLEAYRKLKTSTELKEAFQVIWGNVPQGPINKAVKKISQIRRLEAGVLAWSWR